MIKLQSIRKSKGMTQKELAKVSGVNYDSIRKIETGANSNPGITSVLKICGALQCGVEEVCGCFLLRTPTGGEMKFIAGLKVLTSPFVPSDSVVFGTQKNTS
jgi:transcriptional regulator with XRE-family HTH domain